MDMHVLTTARTNGWIFHFHVMLGDCGGDWDCDSGWWFGPCNWCAIECCFWSALRSISYWHRRYPTYTHIMTNNWPNAMSGDMSDRMSFCVGEISATHTETPEEKIPNWKNEIHDNRLQSGYTNSKQQHNTHKNQTHDTHAQWCPCPCWKCSRCLPMPTSPVIPHWSSHWPQWVDTLLLQNT